MKYVIGSFSIMVGFLFWAIVRDSSNRENYERRMFYEYYRSKEANQRNREAETGT